MPSSKGGLARSLATIESTCTTLRASRTALEDLVQRAPRLYRRFEIGQQKRRTIRPSLEPLKGIQRALADHLDSLSVYSPFAVGGVPGHSILDHARPHVGRKMVATLDISQCFPSTSPAMVQRAFASLGIDEGAASLLARLTTIDDQVPQGAPSSTAVINLVLAELDETYAALCRRYKLCFTRYVDDLAISANYDFEHLSEQLTRPVEDMGYRVSADKTHFMIDGRRQVVTGLIVNERLRPTREWISELKRLIRRTWNEDLDRLAAEHDCPDPFRLHQKIRGRIQHLIHVNERLGKQVRSMTYGTPWPWRSGTVTPVPSGSNSCATLVPTPRENRARKGQILVNRGQL